MTAHTLRFRDHRHGNVNVHALDTMLTPDSIVSSMSIPRFETDKDLSLTGTAKICSITVPLQGHLDNCAVRKLIQHNRRSLDTLRKLAKVEPSFGHAVSLFDLLSRDG